MIRRVRWIAATKALNISSSCRYSVAASGQQPPENDQRQAPLHIPVMLNEVLDLIVHQTPNFRTYVDMTFGAGGHTKAILDANPQAVVYASDRDASSFALANTMAASYKPGRLVPLHAKFSKIGEALHAKGVSESSVDAALIDCGVSSMQFDQAQRGFSISHEGPLDMRMGTEKEQPVSAYDVVNKLDEETLAKIIWRYGEERLSKKIAHGIVYFRSAHGSIRTTKQLADVIATTVKDTLSTDSLGRGSHIATRTFQAIRIFVNNELNELHNGISQIHKYLGPNGRCAVISFHSLEDRIVKNHFNEIDVSNLSGNGADDDGDYFDPERMSKKQRRIGPRAQMHFALNKDHMSMDELATYVRRAWKPLSIGDAIASGGRLLLPSDMEIVENPRARSAKMRVAARI